MDEKPTYEELVAEVRKLKRDYLRLRKAIESSSDAIGITDADNRPVYQNKACGDLFEYTIEELQEAGNPTVLYQDQSVAKQVFGTLFKGKSWIGEVDFVSKTGRKFPVSIRADAIRDETGKIIGVIGIHRDVTEQKDAQEALRKSESKYRDLVETNNDMIWEVNVDSLYTYISPNVRDILGYEPEELVGKAFYDLMENEEAERVRNIFNKLISSQEMFVALESIHRHKNGHMVALETSGKPFFDAKGTLLGYRGVDRDITEKKTLQAEAMRAGHLASLGELASGVAHEINNPITGIINYAEILKDECEEKDEDADIPSRIIKEGERIAQIVKNLTSVCLNQVQNFIPVLIKDVTAVSLSLAKKQINNDGIVISLAGVSGLPAVKAQPQEIHQIFLNILSNARYALNQKFTGPHQTKCLKISGEEIDIDGRPYVRIVFLDHGTGIPEEFMDKICNPFFSSKPMDEGTGLGLSVTHSIVKNHGGRLHFESEEGRYTKVMVDLPVWEDKDPGS